jgi:methyl-accepting chemotaxis protein
MLRTMPPRDLRGLAHRVSGRMLVLDILVAVPITTLWLGLFEVGSVAVAVLLHGLAFVLRALVWIFHRDRALDADVLGRFPLEHALVYALSWAGYFVIGTLLSTLAEALIVGRGELLVGGLLALGISVGVIVPAMLATELDVEARRAELLADLERRGASTNGLPASLASRLVTQSMCLMLGAVLIVVALAWRSELGAARLAAIDLARMRVTRELLAFTDDSTHAPPRDIVLTEQPPTELEHTDPHQRGVLVEIDIERELVIAAAPLLDGRWLVLEQSVTLARPPFWRDLSLALLVVAALVVAGVVAQTRSILAPIERLRAAIARLVRVGDVAAIDRLPVLREDELGALTRDLNRLLDSLALLAATTRTFAHGHVTSDLDEQGELADALRLMFERVRSIVAHTHEATARLGASAAEIRATVQEQELIHAQQSESVHDIAENLASLESSAAEIATAVVEVSDNAESTLAATDELAQSIAQLDERTHGIRELLDIIREVATRSDLLALNGALEATRVGDAGRGFSLVADEMRRLAERVTGTVGDVRRLVADIAEGSENSVDLTELGRSLAEGTTHAAREIASATYRQTSETEQVSHGVRELAAFIVQTTTATKRTRLIADDLQHQAQLLDMQIRAFERGDEVAPK